MLLLFSDYKPGDECESWSGPVVEWVIHWTFTEFVARPEVKIEVMLHKNTCMSYFNPKSFFF